MRTATCASSSVSIIGSSNGGRPRSRVSGFRRAGVEDAARDAVGSALQRGGVRESVDPKLAGVVGGVVGPHALGGDRPDVDDATAALPLHDQERLAATEEGARRLMGYTVPVFDRQVVDRPANRVPTLLTSVSRALRSMSTPNTRSASASLVIPARMEWPCRRWRRSRPPPCQAVGPPSDQRHSLAPFRRHPRADRRANLPLLAPVTRASLPVELAHAALPRPPTGSRATFDLRSGHRCGVEP